MRLRITHIARYEFEKPVEFGLQQSRKTPKSTRGQTVLSWDAEIDGGQREFSFQDYRRNTVDPVSFYPRTEALEIRSVGEFPMADISGIVGKHEGFASLWLFERDTPLTRIVAGCRDLAKRAGGETDVVRLHGLSLRIRETVEYEIGASQSDWTAEQATAEGC